MEKIIHGTYRVVDCEHWGDIDSDRCFLEKLNVKIEDTYWDGRDCGEAYINFSFPESEFERIHKATKSCATYDVDTRDYIKPDRSWEKGVTYPIVDSLSMKHSIEQYRYDESNGFEERIPILVKFVATESVNPQEIMDQFVHLLKRPTKINKIGAYK